MSVGAAWARAAAAGIFAWRRSKSGAGVRVRVRVRTRVRVRVRGVMLRDDRGLRHLHVRVGMELGYWG